VNSQKKKSHPGITRTASVLVGTCALAGCSLVNVPMLDPKGPVALAERDLLLGASAIMLIVVLPVFVMTFWVVYRYRASTHNPNYQPDWDRSRLIEAVIWLVPAAIVIAIGSMVWTYSHKLDPYRPIESDQPTLNVQVIALDWKWLFIYPQHNIATVNELAFPANAPVRLVLTSDTVMNSLSIPALTGQIYVMAGMQTELNFLASEEGTFAGRNVQYSGAGFSDQTFAAKALSRQDFESWVNSAQKSAKALDAGAYKMLAVPSTANPVAFYSNVEPYLFETVIRKYMHDHTASSQQPIDQSSVVHHVR